MAVLISIKPKWCELIANGEKTIEVRKTRPKCETPFKCYIYCTNDRKIMLERSNYDKSIYLNCNIYYPHKKDCSLNGKVIGEFICTKTESFDVPYPAFQNEMRKDILEKSCLTYYELHRYAYHDNLYGWHISSLKIYDKPKELRDFYKPCTPECNYIEECGGTNETHCLFSITRAPQSWMYVEELK